MLNLTARFLHDERGATAVEYGLIAVLISLIVFAGLSAISSTLSSKYQTVSTHLGS